MNLNYIATSEIQAEPTIQRGLSFNTMAIIAIDAGREGEFDTVTAGTDITGYSAELQQAILHTFGQSTKPTYIKVGFVSAVTAAQLDVLKLEDYWYLTTFLPDELLEADLPDLGLWMATNNRVMAFVDTYDVAPDTTAGLNRVARDARIENALGLYAFYDPATSINGGKYIAQAIFAQLATVDFDQPNSYYSLTSFIDSVAGIAPVSLSDNDRKLVTSYEINVGYDLGDTDTVFGNFWGEYGGGYPFMYSGTTPNARSFSDIHFLHWLNRRVQEDLAILMKTERVLTYSDADVAKTLLIYKLALQKGVLAGGLLQDTVNIESTQELKARLTSAIRSNRMLKVMQAEISCAGHFTHIAASAVCVAEDKIVLEEE